MRKYSYNPAMYVKIDDNNNPIFYENSGIYVRPEDAKELIQALTTYINTADFDSLEKEETKYFYDHFYKNEIFRSLALKKNLKSAGVVYFVKRKDGLIKIGCSSNFNNRFKSLKSKYGSLEILFTVDTSNMYVTEFCFHELFKDKRKDGEWFELDDYQFEYVKRGKYFKFISTTIDGNDFDYDLYFKEYYSRRKSS